MVAKLGSGNSYLRPIEAPLVKSKLVPVADEQPSAPGSLQLYDFFVETTSPTCPHSSIRNREDGHVTGDLFEEIEPGCFVFRAFRSPDRISWP